MLALVSLGGHHFDPSGILSNFFTWITVRGWTLRQPVVASYSWKGLLASSTIYFNKGHKFAWKWIPFRLYLFQHIWFRLPKDPDIGDWSMVIYFGFRCITYELDSYDNTSIPNSGIKVSLGLTNSDILICNLSSNHDRNYYNLKFWTIWCEIYHDRFIWSEI